MKKVIISLLAVSFLMVAQLASATRSADKIYSTHCTTCHSAAMSKILKSPQVHDPKAWKPYQDKALAAAIKANPALKNAKKAEQQSAMYDQLVAVAKKGTAKGMPPKGTCMNCTDKEFKDVIEFMATKKK